MKKIIISGLIIIILIFSTILSINIYMKYSTKKLILNEDEYLKINNIDCILVLGAGVRNNTPSPMLKDRLDVAIELYKKKIAPKIIMSGDHGRKNYDEVNIMKEYAIKEGVPSENIFMDHAGFSTYESIYRVKNIFKAKKIVVVTQKYHLYRSLYIAKKLGIKAYGISSDERIYVGQFKRDIREIIARNKDFIKCIFKPKSKYLGNTIPVSGNGDITNDK